MERKKFVAVLGALAAGFLLLTSASAQAQAGAVSGYLMGDPSPGKLVPYWAVGGGLATIVGFENTSGQEGTTGGLVIGGLTGSDEGRAGDILVHVTAFSGRSNEIINDDRCLSPFDFGYVILQDPAATPAQENDVGFENGNAIIWSKADGQLGSNDFGYLTLKVIGKFGSTNGSCNSDSALFYDPTNNSPSILGAAEPLAAWGILQDVGEGFFGTEVPVPTALVNDTDGRVTGGLGAFGLIPGPTQITADTGGVGCSDSGDGSRVIARFDVNPTNGSVTNIFVWQRRNQFNVSGDPAAGCNRLGSQIAHLDCETEREVSLSISLPDEVNILNVANFTATATCTNEGLFRGVLRFAMPDTGFVWSHLSQEDANFRNNFLGINMDCNWFISGFIDPANIPDITTLPLSVGDIEHNRSCNDTLRQNNFE